MEKAILKTLAYSDLFDYPLKAWEIHKWLISKKGSLRQVERVLKSLSQKSKIKSQKGWYFLPGKNTLISKRLIRRKQSLNYLRQIKLIAQLFRLIPWVKLVGVSGSLAMENSSQKDDIDLFIITSRNRLWLTRILLLGVVDFLGKRRKRGENFSKIAGKICINTLLSEDSLAQQDKNIYLAHEVLQMKVLWQRDGMYTKYLSDNEWVFKYLPNWATSTGIMYHVSSIKGKKHNTYYIIHTAINLLENLARWFQLKYMGKPQGMERITETALYFHPEDQGLRILNLYQKRLKKLEITLPIAL